MSFGGGADQVQDISVQRCQEAGPVKLAVPKALVPVPAAHLSVVSQNNTRRILE